MSMQRRLEGKVALVTGASRGIGRATAALFANQGALLALNYLKNADAALELVEEIRGAGQKALALQANVAEKRAVEGMIEKVTAEFGTIDILVNNAGIFRLGELMTIDEEALDEMIAVNLKGIIHCARAVAPGMMKQGSGKIVNISSIAGLGTAVAGTTPYGATKAAVIALTKRMALELGPHGINVNGICPGFIQTDMMGTVTDVSQNGRLSAMAKKAMLGRIGTPEDVARCALFLASDEASFITAQVITVDGGRMDFLSHSV
jgi:3-oxoacyl-[acyl-carrier protein] reductase